MLYRDILLTTLEYTKKPLFTDISKKPSIHWTPSDHTVDNPYVYWDHAEGCLSGKVHSLPMCALSENAKKYLIYLESFAVLEADSRYTTQRQDLHQYELRFTLAGQGVLNYRGRKYILNPGEGYFIDNTEPHYYAACKDGWISSILHFNGYMVESIFRQFAENGGVKFSRKTCPNFEMYQYEILHTLQSFRPYREYKVSCLFDQLLTSLLDNEEIPLRSNVTELIKNAVSYIESHYAENLTVQKLCDTLFVSRKHLSREFRKYMGVSPKSYIRYVRISKAKLLLKTTDSPIKDVAFLVGFMDYSSFAEAFKSSENMTPLQYRKCGIL